MNKKETLAALGDELTSLEGEISRQCLLRERVTYRLEQAVRDRLAQHVASLAREETR